VIFDFEEKPVLSRKKGQGLEISGTFLYRIFYGDHLALCMGSCAIVPRRPRLGIDLAGLVQVVQEMHS
jgi:hypothetical protein